MSFVCQAKAALFMSSASYEGLAGAADKMLAEVHVVHIYKVHSQYVWSQ